MSKDGRIERSRTLLEQALRNLPADGSLLGAKLEIKKAIERLREHVQKKSASTPATRAGEMNQKWQDMLKSNLHPWLTSNPIAGRDTLKMIEQMIEDEEQKLNDIQNSQNKPDEPLKEILG